MNVTAAQFLRHWDKNRNGEWTYSRNRGGTGQGETKRRSFPFKPVSSEHQSSACFSFLPHSASYKSTRLIWRGSRFTVFSHARLVVSAIFSTDPYFHLQQQFKPHQTPRPTNQNFRTKSVQHLLESYDFFI